MNKRTLPRSFYEQPTLEVARRLLGKYLVRVGDSGPLVGKIVETEAYIGPEDRASHASRGRTKRTEVMFGPAGYAYVYLIYGVHYCLNVVTEQPEYPAAVLIRAVEPLSGPYEGALGPAGRRLTNGPGKVCRYFGIDRSFNGVDLCGSLLFIEDRGEIVLPEEVVQTTRIGVEYAGRWKDKPWRFYLRPSAYVSRR
jgi:DNA-3-methyladenine glycosylase